MIGAEEEATLLRWNDTRVERDGTPLHRLIERQADATPDAIAVACDGETLTYIELDRAANRVANRLVQAGAGPDRVVAVMMDRSPEMVAAILGVMKSGAAYLPIDPGTPRERIEWMLAESEALTTLVDANGAEDDGRVEVTPNASNLAYVIYTSGSTGRPKGVMNTHGALANRIHWMQEAYRLDASDRVLQKTAFTFDVSVWEIFWPLIAGARLVLARAGAHTDGAYLVDTIASHGVTAIHFVPSLLRLFLEERDVERCRSLRLMVCSGEALTAALRDAVATRLECRLENLYGPT
jgi:non-ribosomal peptide synthetase component F